MCASVSSSRVDRHFLSSEKWHRLLFLSSRRIKLEVEWYHVGWVLNIVGLSSLGLLRAPFIGCVRSSPVEVHFMGARYVMFHQPLEEWPVCPTAGTCLEPPSISPSQLRIWGYKYAVDM
eukprot:689667-Amphidinium_carterae.7